MAVRKNNTEIHKMMLCINDIKNKMDNFINQINDFKDDKEDLESRVKVNELTIARVEVYIKTQWWLIGLILGSGIIALIGSIVKFVILK